MKAWLALLMATMLSEVDAGPADVDAGVSGSTMRLEIVGLRNGKGHVLIAVYRPGDGFSETKSSAFRKETVAATEGGTTVELKNLPVGTYAIALIHDENDNNKIDTGFFGLPVEGFCFSRGAMGLFGPPSFKDAAVSHTLEGGTQKLVVKY